MINRRSFNSQFFAPIQKTYIIFYSLAISLRPGCPFYLSFFSHLFFSFIFLIFGLAPDPLLSIYKLSFIFSSTHFFSGLVLYSVYHFLFGSPFHPSLYRGTPQYPVDLWILCLIVRDALLPTYRIRRKSI